MLRVPGHLVFKPANSLVREDDIHVLVPPAGCGHSGAIGDVVAVPFRSALLIPGD